MIDFSLDREDSTPLYVQVAAEIRRRISEGVYAPGDTVPTVRQFAEHLGISLRTVTLAFQQLAEEGFLKSYGPAGTRVLRPAAPPGPAQRKTQEDALRVAAWQALQGGMSADEIVGVVRQSLSRALGT